MRVLHGQPRPIISFSSWDLGFKSAIARLTCGSVHRGGRHRDGRGTVRKDAGAVQRHGGRERRTALKGPASQTSVVRRVPESILSTRATRAEPPGFAEHGPHRS